MNSANTGCGRNNVLSLIWFYAVRLKVERLQNVPNWSQQNSKWVHPKYKSVRDTIWSDIKDQMCQIYYQILIFAMEWTDFRWSFAVETYFKTQESISLTLKTFRNHFKLNKSVPLPAHLTIRRWVQKFRSTSSVKKKKPTGRLRSIRISEWVCSWSSAPIIYIYIYMSYWRKPRTSSVDPIWNFAGRKGVNSFLSVFAVW